MGIDYYGVLQLRRVSTDFEVKQAYRRLALEFHPDKLKEEGSQRVFALVGEAYDVLGDHLKRAIFDQYGEEGLKKGVAGPGIDGGCVPPYIYHGDPMKTYRDFFGTISPFANILDYLNNPYKIPGYPCKPCPKKQEAIRHPLCLTLHEIFFGGIKKMKIHRLAYIDSTHTVTEIREKILTIPIKPGIRPGTEIVFPEEGDQNPGETPADVIFITEDRPHEMFERVNDDLVTVVDLSLEDAMIGLTVTINTIDHRTVRIPITDVVSPNYEKVIENEGMPIFDKYPERGNLIIRFQIEFPDYLPKASRNLIKKGFDLAKISGGLHQYEAINKLVLADKILRVDLDEQFPPSLSSN